MIKSKKLIKFNKINHAFFNKNGGKSSGIYKSLNCGIGSLDNKKNVFKNLTIVSKKIECSKNQMGDLFKVMLVTNKKINFKTGF